jgi:teichuronic acid biosynthesis protein TuaF
MANLEKTMISDIIKRMAKYKRLLMILPLLTASIAYIFEKNTPPTYTAQAKIELGNFQNLGLTNDSKVEQKLTSTTFLEEITNKYGLNTPVEKIKERLKITSDNKILTLTYHGDHEDEVEETLSKIVDSFIKESDKLYNKKYELIKGKIEATEKIHTIEEAISKQEFLYDLKMTLTDLRKTQIVEPVSVTASYNNPFKRSVFGFLIGIMMNLVILLGPEIFRKKES